MPVPGEETTDGVLAVRAVAGDEPAFEDLVRRYQARVYRLAVRLTGNDGDAQDALQETFLQVYRSLGGFRGEARFSTWLYRVATNAAPRGPRPRRGGPAGARGAVPPRLRAARR